MQSDEGILQNFLDGQIPEGWTNLTAGKIVKIEDCYFRIINVDIPAQELILKPMPRREAVKEILEASENNFKKFVNGIPEFKG
jgi:hypothetical protein